MAYQRSQEQLEFQSTLRAFLSEALPSEYLRRRIDSHGSVDPTFWKKLGSLGILESFGAEDPEGRPGTPELAIVAFECGHNLVTEPLADHCLGGPFFIQQILSGPERACLEAALGKAALSRMADGSARVAVSLLREGDSLTFSPGKAGAVLARVRGAAEADFYLCLKRTSAVAAHLYILARSASTKVTPQPLLDRSIGVGEVALEGVAAAELTGPPANQLLHLFHMTRAMEMAGAVARSISMTIEYVKQRKQFGVPIGGFQAVQHRLADMYLQSEALNALGHFSSWAAAESSEQLALSSAALLIQACDNAGGIAEGAIQMHGGIGFTWEYDLHLYVRRIKCLEALMRFSEHELMSVLEIAA